MMFEDENPPIDGDNQEGTSELDEMAAEMARAEKEKSDQVAAENERADLLAKELEAVYDVPVQISAVIGRAHMPVNQLLKLGRGAIVELDRRVGESIDVFVNNRLVARGEVVVVDDRLGITMTEILKSGRS